MRSLLAAAAVGAFLLLFGAGCGGIDKGKLESSIKSQTNDQLKSSGSSKVVSSVSCTKAGDDYHFTCDLQGSDGATLLTVRATCTKEGTCRWGRT
ncbi:MAG: hypothetical protein H0W87_02005 [Actinobacteria bacterium]|nr:hypothetical protein [Actinomycetota bacterium]